MESAVSTADPSPAVEAHLRLSTRLVAGSIPTSTGFGVLSEAAGLAAWLAVDRCDAGTARRRYADAVHYARRTRNPLLTAYMLASVGQYAVESSDPRQGLSLLREAQQELGGLGVSNAARAWLAAQCALAYAATGDRFAAMNELKTAEKLTANTRGEPRWPWLFAFDALKAARFQASTLAKLGDFTAAQQAFAVATSGLLAPKPRAWIQLDHARVLAKSGQLDEACALAVDALAVGKRYQSERVTQGVRNLRANMPLNSREAAVLDDSLAALYTDASE